MSEELELPEQLRIRREKRERIIESGKEAYPVSVPRTKSLAAIRSKYEGLAIDTATGKTVMRINPKFYRPAEVELLIGDPAHAKTKLGWQPKYDLDALVKEMVAADVELFTKEKHLKESGFKINISN